MNVILVLGRVDYGAMEEAWNISAAWISLAFTYPSTKTARYMLS